MALIGCLTASMYAITLKLLCLYIFWFFFHILLSPTLLLVILSVVFSRPRAGLLGGAAHIMYILCGGCRLADFSLETSHLSNEYKYINKSLLSLKTSKPSLGINCAHYYMLRRLS